MPKRIEFLDSMRGLAATQVVICHCFSIFPALFAAYSRGPIYHWMIWALTYTPLHLFWDGPEAVIFFFVLSGFVLALPFLDGKRYLYVSFAIRRFFRIWVPFAAVILVSMALIWAIQPRPEISGTSDWFTPKWSHVVGKREFLRILLMTDDMNNVDSPAWTLAYELRISFFFPFVVAWVIRTKWWFHLAAGLLLSFGSEFAQGRFNFFGSYFLISTLYYVPFFIYGCSLAKYKSEVSDFLGKFKIWQKVAVLFAGLALYNWEWEFWVGPSSGFGTGHTQLVANLATGTGSLLLIGLALSFQEIQNFLSLPILLWTGKVSYSLYLTHLIVLLSAVYFLPVSIPLVGRVLLGSFFSFVVAGVSHRWLELPALSMGHQLAKKYETLMLQKAEHR